ncbi:MAG: hypothetical protein ACR650_15810 [Methylocystis sp.]
MVDINASSTSAEPSSDKSKRERSTIEFPYSDLSGAMEIASTIFNKAGTSCEVAQLAGWLDQSAEGGTFRTRLSAARLFGFVETERGGGVSLTSLGRSVINPSQEIASKVTAFLNVPLFKQMYDQYNGHVLPPAAAIERQMIQLGVSSKQADRARQNFTKSAQQAGFVDGQTGRFIKPACANARPEDKDGGRPEVGDDDRRGGGNNGDDGGLSLDPLLIALLKKIPPAEKGSWPAAQRIRWFRTFAMNVSQIYDGDDDPVEMEIKAVAAG